MSHKKENVICSLCECGNACREFAGIKFHVIENPFEFVECGKSPVHNARLTRAPIFTDVDE